MFNTTTIQPSSVECIPLQPITGRTGISDGNEEVQAEVSTSESQQTSSESQDEAHSASDPASAETDSGSGEPQPTNPTSAVDKWPLRLNATQVLIGVLALAGFLAMVYPQVIDHFINRDSLKLSEWTAWMTFRDECRALLNEGKDIGEDCTDVLHQPLPRPPVPVDENYPRHEENITHDFHIASKLTNMQKRSTILRLGGFLVRRPAWLAAVFLSPLVLVFWYRKLYRSSQQQSIRRVELYRTWVTDEVARLQPYQSIGYTTGQDTVTWLKTLCKRITVQEYTYTEIQYNENQTIISFDQTPETVIHLDLTDTSPPPLSLVKAWNNATQNSLEDENTEAVDEGPRLPVVNNFQDENTEAVDEGPRLPVVNNFEDENTEAANESSWLPVINKFGESEGSMIAQGRADLENYLSAAQQTKNACDYRGYSNSPSWLQNTCTFCSIFPVRFWGHLRDNNGHWLIKVPQLSFETATVCLVDIIGTWRYWQPEELRRELTDSQDMPCLYVMSVGQRHVRLIFENISNQQYTTIMNGLGNDHQGHRQDCCHSHIPAGDVELHLGIIQKVMFAAGEGSLDTYSYKCTNYEWGPMYGGNAHTYWPP